MPFQKSLKGCAQKPAAAIQKMVSRFHCLTEGSFETRLTNHISECSCVSFWHKLSLFLERHGGPARVLKQRIVQKLFPETGTKEIHQSLQMFVWGHLTYEAPFRYEA